MSVGPSKYQAWNELFDRMVERDQVITESGDYQQIYRMAHPRSWNRGDMAAQKKRGAIDAYNLAVYMNVSIRDNINKLHQPSHPNVIPSLFHASASDFIRDIVVEGKIHPSSGKVWFADAPEYQFGDCGVAINASQVKISGHTDSSYKEGSMWYYTDRDVDFNFSFDIIFTKNLEDTIELHGMLNARSFKYNILTIGLLGVQEFEQFCLQYNRVL